VEYPVTADATAASIQGLPFSSVAVVNSQGGYVTLTDASVAIVFIINANQTAFRIVEAATGGGVLNSTLSGKTLRGTLIYRADN